MPPENCLMNSHQPWDYENTLLQNTHQNAINGVNFPIIRGRGERFSLFNIYLHKEADDFCWVKTSQPIANEVHSSNLLCVRQPGQLWHFTFLLFLQNCSEI